MEDTLLSSVQVKATPSWLQGLWKLGRADGPGRYKWRNRNEYDGEWKNGKMHGQGTLKWGSGERYDGEWKEGEEDGLGVFTWLDGSSYDGFWQHGRKHGIGVSRELKILVRSRGDMSNLRSPAQRKRSASR